MLQSQLLLLQGWFAARHQRRRRVLRDRRAVPLRLFPAGQRRRPHRRRPVQRRQLRRAGQPARRRLAGLRPDHRNPPSLQMLLVPPAERRELCPVLPRRGLGQPQRERRQPRLADPGRDLELLRLQPGRIPFGGLAERDPRRPHVQRQLQHAVAAARRRVIAAPRQRRPLGSGQRHHAVQRAGELPVRL